MPEEWERAAGERPLAKERRESDWRKSTWQEIAREQKRIRGRGTARELLTRNNDERAADERTVSKRNDEKHEMARRLLGRRLTKWLRDG